MQKIIAGFILCLLVFCTNVYAQTPQDQNLIDWINIRRSEANLQELDQYGYIQEFRKPVQFDPVLDVSADTYSMAFTGLEVGPPPEGLVDFGIAQLFWQGHNSEYITRIWGSRPYNDIRDLDYQASILLNPKWTRVGVGRSLWNYDIDTVVVWFGEGEVITLNTASRGKGKKK